MTLFKKITITFLLLMVSSQLIKAQSLDEKISVHATEVFFQITGKIKAPINYFIIESGKSKTADVKYAFNFTDGGWLILKDTNSFELMAFSKKGIFAVENNPLMLDALTKKVLIDKKNGKAIVEKSIFNNVTNKNSTTTTNPFLTDTWGGVNCFTADGSNVYPTNYFTPNHASPGCVAIATAQILHYYEWPKIGVGSNVYNDTYDGTFMRHEAFFDEIEYDWANMLDAYMYVDSSDIEQQAVGKLMYHTGIAIEMDYELTGSTNNLNNVPFALENFFRFSGAYLSSSLGSFWTKVRENVENLRPVPIAIQNSANSEGHVVVANGHSIIGTTPYFHLNWGWYDLAPTNNGWYNIQGWNAGDTGYDTVDGAIFNMLPEPQITNIANNGNGDDFLIEWEVSNRLNWSEFTLEQKVDQTSNWIEVATGITDKFYTITNPTGDVYQFRVKAMVDGIYYTNSWSEREVYAISGSYNGYGSFESTSQYAYAKQTPDNALDFTGDYTFETWIRVHPNNQNGNVLLDQRSVFGLTIDEVTASDFSIKFKSHSSGLELHSNNSGSKLLNSQWVHVAVSKSGNSAKLFVDGVLRDSATGGFNLIASNYYLNIGEKHHGSYADWIVADFDQLRISSVGRYANTFTPNQTTEFNVDTNTVLYLTFQNVHRVRLKDEAHNLSVVVKNAPNYVNWKFDAPQSTASTIDIELLNDVIQVYPNPTIDFITITFKNNDTFLWENLSFTINDINGKLVKNVPLDEINKIDLSNLTSGTYFLQVKGNDFSASKKIIKQ